MTSETVGASDYPELDDLWCEIRAPLQGEVEPVRRIDGEWIHCDDLIPVLKEHFVRKSEVVVYGVPPLTNAMNQWTEKNMIPKQKVREAIEKLRKEDWYNMMGLIHPDDLNEEFGL